MKAGLNDFGQISPVSRGRMIMTKNNRNNKKRVFAKTSANNTANNTSFRNTANNSSIRKTSLQTSLEDLNAPKILKQDENL